MVRTFNVIRTGALMYEVKWMSKNSLSTTAIVSNRKDRPYSLCRVYSSLYRLYPSVLTVPSVPAVPVVKASSTASTEPTALTAPAVPAVPAVPGCTDFADCTELYRVSWVNRVYQVQETAKNVQSSTRIFSKTGTEQLYRFRHNREKLKLLF